MRVLYLGDIVGEKTIDVLKDHLEDIKRRYKINMVLANAENTTGGKGLSEKDYKKLKTLGIAGMSMGNHTFSKSEIKDYIDDATIARPANYTTNIGKEVLYVRYNDEVIAIVNLLGRTFVNGPLDCPFKKMDELLKTIKADKIIVDFHGEATSEKKAFVYDFKGRVDAVLGSHTHVQTADEENIDGTLYITDMGMCGPKESIIGDDIDSIIDRFRSGIFGRLAVANSKNYMINGVVLDFNTKKIERVNEVYSV
ncbi:MAG: YmdB family metallophosphoesterase [Acholeplasmatales bacterium]|nr:YmdB family metallophosphoesterase [Acholeplasmatales bacterium]